MSPREVSPSSRIPVDVDHPDVFDVGVLRDVWKFTIPQNATLPALGLVLRGASRFTTGSHLYTASMATVVTATSPTPVDVFRNRRCGAAAVPKNSTVIIIPWAPADTDTVGQFRLQVQAVQIPSGRIEFIREGIVEVTPSP